MRRLDFLCLSFLHRSCRNILTGEHAATYDADGAVDYLDVFKNAIDAFTQFTIAAAARLPRNLVDLTARAGYSLIGKKPKTPHEIVSEYFTFDWEFAQTPEQSSFIGSSWVRLAYYPAMSCGRLISLTVARDLTGRTM